ncbi:MAG: hypothetical protein WAZ36_01195 [Sediminibacterium sp.]
MNTIKTKSFWVSLLFFTLTFNALAAQDIANYKNRTPQERAQLQTEWMTGKLNLTPTQASQVQSINLIYIQKNDLVLKSDAGKLSKFRQLKTIQKDKDAELKKELSADQYNKYQHLKEEMKAEMKKRRSE